VSQPSSNAVVVPEGIKLRLSHKRGSFSLLSLSLCLRLI